jgi:hypothetical protein
MVSPLRVIRALVALALPSLHTLARRNRAAFPSRTRQWPLVNGQADVFQVGGRL